MSSHAHNNTVRIRVRANFRELPYFLDSNLGNHAAIANSQSLISLRHCSNPLHGEILQGEKQRSEIATFHLHAMRGKQETNRFVLFSPYKRSSDEMLVRKDVRFVRRCLDAKAWARRFTLPARGRCLQGLSAIFGFHICDSNQCREIGCSRNASS